MKRFVKRFHTNNFPYDAKGLAAKSVENISKGHIQKERSSYILLISPLYSMSEINLLHSQVFDKIKDYGNLIGAVVDVGFKGWSLTSCEGIAFYSKPGRLYKQKSVGRWHLRPQFEFPDVSQDKNVLNQSIIPEQLKEDTANSKLFLTFSVIISLIHRTRSRLIFTSG